MNRTLKRGGVQLENGIFRTEQIEGGVGRKDESLTVSEAGM